MKKAGDILGSWRMTAIVLLLLVAAYLACYYQERPFACWSGFLFHSPSGILLYCLLPINLLLASIRIIIARLSPPVLTSDYIKFMDSYIEMTSTSLDAVTGWASTHGFSGRFKGNSFEAKKGAWSFIPGTVFRLGIVMILTAFLISSHLRRSEEIIVHKGDSATFQSDNIKIGDISSDMPDEFLLVGESGNFKIKNVSVIIDVSGRSYQVTGGYPVRIGGRYYRIRDIGISQEVSLTSSQNTDFRRLNLNILPPGKTDIVSFLPGNIFVTFSLSPEKTITKGILTGKQYDIKNPFYHIVIQRGKANEKLEAFTAKAGDTIKSDLATLSLGEKSVFAKMQVVSDPALLWLYAGLIIALSGLALMISRFFWYEIRIVAIKEGKRTLIGYQEEFYKRWGMLKFENWKEELISGPDSAPDKKDTAG